MSKVMTDLRGYSASGQEEASSKSKLLAATAVVLGVVAVGAYAYTSHSLLPSTPVAHTSVASQPIPLTPPAQPAISQPDVTAPAPQQMPAVQAAPAPEITAPAPHASVKAKSSEHVAHVKARTPVTRSETAPAVTPSDTTQVPATPSQTMTPNVTAPNAKSTTPYTAAPAITPSQTVTPQTTAPDSTTTTTQPPQTQQQTTPDQSAPQAQSPQ